MKENFGLYYIYRNRTNTKMDQTIEYTPSTIVFTPVVSPDTVGGSDAAHQTKQAQQKASPPIFVTIGSSLDSNRLVEQAKGAAATAMAIASGM
jgi:hypothetical protein